MVDIPPGKDRIFAALDVGRSGATAAHGAGTPRTLAVFADPVFAATDPLFRVDTGGAVSESSSRLGAPRALPQGRRSGRYRRARRTGFSPGRDGIRRQSRAGAQRAAQRLIASCVSPRTASSIRGIRASSWHCAAAGQPQKLLRCRILPLNADFVVLSGCETALGREIRGEALIGLVDGFLYAGARNLVVSLWQVPDSAPAEQRRSDPYFWGAFVVRGDS